MSQQHRRGASGFEETARLSVLSPGAIASAAMEHAQDDDITVVGVRVRALAREAEPALDLATSPA